MRVKSPLSVLLALLISMVSTGNTFSAEPALTPVPDVVSVTRNPLPTVPIPPIEETTVEVSVVGTRVKRTAGSAHVLRAKEMERLEYDDPHAVVASVPGVYSRGEDGVGLRPNIGMRGANPDRSKKITLMEDGVLFGPAPYSAPAAYYFPLITRMSQVRVIKGPGAISFGPQTVGGALDLVTRSAPSDTTAGIDLGGGQYGYGKTHGYFGANQGDTSFIIEGVHLRDDGWKALPNGADIGFTRNEWMWKGVHRLPSVGGGKHQIQLKLTYADEDSKETYLGLSDADFARNPLMRYDASQLDRMEWFRTSGVLTHTIEPTSTVNITTSLYRHNMTRSWRKVNRFQGASLYDVLTNPNDPENQVYNAILTGKLDSSIPAEILLVGPNRRDFVSQGAQSVLQWNPETSAIKHRVEFGLRGHFDSIDRRHSEDGYFLRAGQLVPAGIPTVVTALNRASTVAVAANVADAMTWRGLTVTPGVRMELIWSNFSDSLGAGQTERFVPALLPGVGIYQSLSERVGLLAGVYRGFSPPAPGADKSVDSESSVNYEAGARYSDGALQAEIIGFFNDYSNLTDVCTLSSGCLDINLDRQFDAGSARIFGIESYARRDFRLGTFTVPLGFAHTYTRARFESDFVSQDPIYGDVAKGDELPYVPKHTLHASLGVEHGRGGIAVSANYVSAMREVAGRGALSSALVTDEAFTVDASARVRLYRSWSLYSNVRNVMDANYIVSRRPFGARPNIPRWVQLGIRSTF
ncbi:MAG: TonB-dependent receptor [Deltaproteobacteria bacterium]|nr:TonB-dependent receptor [Deltaproteobacteria bacterium]